MFTGVAHSMGLPLKKGKALLSSIYKKGGNEVQNCPQIGVQVVFGTRLFFRYFLLLTSHVKKTSSAFPVHPLTFFSPFTDSEVTRQSCLQLLTAEAPLGAVSFFAVSWVLLPLSPYLMLK